MQLTHPMVWLNMMFILFLDIYRVKLQEIFFWIIWEKIKELLFCQEVLLLDQELTFNMNLGKIIELGRIWKCPLQE